MNDDSENYNSCCIGRRAEQKMTHSSLRTRSKSKRHSPPTSLLGCFTNVPATRLERWQRIAQNNRTLGYVAHSWKNHHRLLLENWNVLTLTRKELKLGKEAKKYHLIYIVGVSSTKTRGSKIVDLNGECKYVSPSGCGNSHKPSVSYCLFD